MSLIQDYALQDVTIVPRATGYDSYGQPDYTSATSVTTKARVSNKERKEYRMDGAVTIYDKVFWFVATEDITDGDRITHNSVNHEVVRIDRPTFLDGTASHLKVMVLTEVVR